MKINLSDSFSERLRAAMNGIKLEELYDSDLSVDDLNVLGEMAVSISPMNYENRLSTYGNIRQIIENYALLIYCRFFPMLPANHWCDELITQMKYYGSLVIDCRKGYEKKCVITKRVLVEHSDNQDFFETIVKMKFKKEGIECADELLDYIYDQFSKEILSEDFVNLVVGYNLSTRRKLTDSDYDSFRLEMLSQVLHDDFFER